MCVNDMERWAHYFPNTAVETNVKRRLYNIYISIFSLVPKRNLGSRCKNDEVCKDENAICKEEGVCACAETFFQRSGTCGKLFMGVFLEGKLTFSLQNIMII